jgi:GTPase SAR1 family protein
MEANLKRVFESGEVTWNRMTVIVVGQESSGKTCLANRLIPDNKFWTTKSYFEESVFERRTAYGRTISNGRKLKGFFPSPKQMESMVAFECFESTFPEILPATENVSSSLQFSKFDMSAFADSCSEADALRNSGEKDRCVSVTLHDFVGQTVFDLIHPLFFSKSAVYIVTFDMELFLAELAMESNSCIEKLKFWMDSLYEWTYDVTTKTTAPVALVGTRMDKVLRTEHHEEISARLLEKFGDHPVWRSLIWFVEKQSPFFPVDTTVSDDSRISLLLKSCIKASKLKCFIGRRIPISWICFYDHLQQLSRPFLPLAVAKKDAGQFSLVSEEIEQMLMFFCDSGLLIWVESGELRDLIILDLSRSILRPAAMFVHRGLRMIDDVVRLNDQEVNRKDLTDDWLRMLQCGIATQRLLMYLVRPADSDSLEQLVDDVLSFMKHYGLIYECGSDSCKLFLVPHFFPLKPDPYDSFGVKPHAHPPISSNVEFYFALSVHERALAFPLLSTRYMFSSGYLPRGVFGSFIARILSRVANSAQGVDDFLVRSSLVAYSDVVMINFQDRQLLIQHTFASSMLRLEVEPKGDRNFADFHDILCEILGEVLTQRYPHVRFVTALELDNSIFLTLSELKNIESKKLTKVSYTCPDTVSTYASSSNVLLTRFSIWLKINREENLGGLKVTLVQLNFICDNVDCFFRFKKRFLMFICPMNGVRTRKYIS